MGAYRRWTHLMNGAVMRANVVTSEFTSGENISEEAIREALSVDRRADHPNHEKAGCALKYDGCGRGNILWPSLSGARIIRRGSVFRVCVFRRNYGVGAVYLIGSVTMSWWAQGEPDVEEVHAALSEGSIDS